jgi:hypothetical protein
MMMVVRTSRTTPYTLSRYIPKRGGGDKSGQKKLKKLVHQMGCKDLQTMMKLPEKELHSLIYDE